jgi:hypothetical protein
VRSMIRALRGRSEKPWKNPWIPWENTEITRRTSPEPWSPDQRLGSWVNHDWTMIEHGI